VAASWNRIVDPPEGVISARRGYYSMIDKIEAHDPKPVVFHLKFATAAFLPALADPYAFIYKKESCSTATRTGLRKTSWAQARSALRNIS
jgi:peptide/nickel transport system substrate-binding protein